MLTYDDWRYIVACYSFLLPFKSVSAPHFASLIRGAYDYGNPRNAWAIDALEKQTTVSVMRKRTGIVNLVFQQ